jgi:hypothetical protein
LAVFSFGEDQFNAESLWNVGRRSTGFRVQTLNSSFDTESI